MAYTDVMESDAGVKEWTALIVCDTLMNKILLRPQSDDTASHTSMGVLQHPQQHGLFSNALPSFAQLTTVNLPLPLLSYSPQFHLSIGGFWDFTSDLSSKDTAYTSLALAAHTDTTYFTDPCGLQMFHLLSHTDGEGGASLLVDGFKAAATLKLEAPDAYEILSTSAVPAHASGNEGISIQPVRVFPVLNHDPETGRLIQVRWNNDDRGTLRGDQAKIGEWYHAARTWAGILRRGSNEYWEQLRPGRPLSEPFLNISTWRF